MDIYYWYDSYGNLSAIRYADGTVDNIYYVVCNSRGDVEAFYNGSGTVKSRYVYDSWGNVIKVVNANGVEITNQNDVAFINPIRYRGYYFDSETGLYYLKSRYYDPQVGRFINADGYASTGQGVLGNNMFAYCGNNPVSYSDNTGTCFYNARGKWCHDNWEFSGGYKRKPEPKKNNTSQTTPSSSYSAKNKDGSYSLYDNQRKSSENIFHEQILSANVSSPSFSLKDGSATFGSASATLMTGGWEFKYVDVSALDIGHAEASLGFEDGQFSASAMASAWSPSFTIKLWDLEITLSAQVGSVGFDLSGGKKGINAGGAFGLGASISVDW